MRYLLLLFFLLLSPLYSTNLSTVVKLDIKSTIGPASSNYLKEGIAVSLQQNAHLILIVLDTPGGLSTSMRGMIQYIANSPIPVVTYVSPRGAHAASAGTYLLYASHIAAMAPGTNLGAASPINITPIPKSEDSNNSAASTLEKKVMNDAMAYIKSLAELNDRNISWALDAVKEAKSISAKDALKYKVIDLMANDTKDLLSKLDGRNITVADKNIKLKTKDAIIYDFKTDWKTNFLSIVTNPTIAYVFLLIAIYGIFFELINPGTIFSGVIGVISGVIALYALNMIPFNYAGLLLIILGIAFMVSEVFISGFGIFGIGGAISFAFGSLLLFDADTIGNSISLPFILAFTLVSLAFFILVMRLFLYSRSAKILTGEEEMVGSVAKVIKSRKKDYLVLCHGEIWNATSQSKLSVGDRVIVIALSGLTLKVKPIKE